MPRIISINSKLFEKFLLKIGCDLKRTKGDHKIYVKNDLKRPLIVPKRRELPVFIIKNNLRILGISHNEYLDILGKV